MLDVSFDEDTSTQITLLASDIDQDALTFSIAGGDAITADLVVDTITFTAAQDFNGSETFTISVSDGEYIDSQSILVTVNPVNDAPQAQSFPVNINEDEVVVITFPSGFDVDGDALTHLLDQDVANGDLVNHGNRGILEISGILKSRKLLNFLICGSGISLFSFSSSSSSSTSGIAGLVSRLCLQVDQCYF